MIGRRLQDRRAQQSGDAMPVETERSSDVNCDTRSIRTGRPKDTMSERQHTALSVGDRERTPISDHLGSAQYTRDV
jgi:hypothetical protein